MATGCLCRFLVQNHKTHTSRLRQTSYPELKSITPTAHTYTHTLPRIDTRTRSPQTQSHPVLKSVTGTTLYFITSCWTWQYTSIFIIIILFSGIYCPFWECQELPDKFVVLCKMIIKILEKSTCDVKEAFSIHRLLGSYIYRGVLHRVHFPEKQNTKHNQSKFF